MEARRSGSRRTDRPGSFTMGGEYFMQQVDATQSGDPSFHGGEAFFSWLITGEVRVYNTQNGDFKQVSPLRTVFSGGPGAWELMAHVNTVDLDSGSISGGKFWRFTPRSTGICRTTCASNSPTGTDR